MNFARTYLLTTMSIGGLTGGAYGALTPNLKVRYCGEDINSQVGKSVCTAVAGGLSSPFLVFMLPFKPELYNLAVGKPFNLDIHDFNFSSN